MVLEERGFVRVDLGEGSDVLYLERFLDHPQADEWLQILDRDVPWCRPSLFIYGRNCKLPRETCYVADAGLPPYMYTGYQPTVHEWDECAALTSIRDFLHETLAETSFNSVLLNRYASGNEHVSWHADDEKLYGLTPTIASISLGAEREFLVRKKQSKAKALESGSIKRKKAIGGSTRLEQYYSAVASENVSSQARGGGSNAISVALPELQRHSFYLKHGSLLVMRGNMQRDWEHSLPMRKRVSGLRINLTFRTVLV